ncbi:MAG: hypothetical protein E7004_01330 [Alphaproteobacteria bacterium]|nr:hypothetical protein [Alphaproteobacteria bacterium]
MEKFEKERQFVLDLAKQGIDINLNLNSKQRKYIKNLLLFALMNASSNTTVTDRNFIKLVNTLFKTYLVKIIKESLDDDDDEDWEAAISVELNKIIASDNLKALADMQEIFTPSQIFSFLKKYTKGVSQRDLIEKMRALREAKSNYRETPEETKKRERNQREYSLMLERQRLMERSRGSRSRG